MRKLFLAVAIAALVGCSGSDAADEPAEFAAYDLSGTIPTNTRFWLSPIGDASGWVTVGQAIQVPAPGDYAVIVGLGGLQSTDPSGNDFTVSLVVGEVGEEVGINYGRVARSEQADLTFDSSVTVTSPALQRIAVKNASGPGEVSAAVGHVTVERLRP